MTQKKLIDPTWEARKMKRTRLLVFALMSAATLVLASPPVAQANDVNCPPNLIGAQVDGNVVVPENQTCAISLSEIRGNVIVKRGAALNFFRSTVYGNIEGDGFRDILVNQSSVLILGVGDAVVGSVIAKNGSNPGRARVIGSSLEGNVQFENNAGELNITNSSVGGLDAGGNIQLVKNRTTSAMSILGNRVADIQFYENTAGSYDIRNNNFDTRGNVQVYKNVHTTQGRVIDNSGQNVQCFENTPTATFVGGPNPLATKAEGQCFK